MPRARKKHVQQAFEFRRHGGKRKGAGRPPKGKRSTEPHKKRARVDPRHPQHLNTRVLDDVGSLRKRDLYHAIREATITVFRHAVTHDAGFHLVHASIQRTHLHLMAEATNEDALAEGMQVFLSVAARLINRAIWRRTGVRRRGRVFADRYHAVALTTPRQVRNCLAYVLNNWRRHGEDRDRTWNVDPFSTGIWFPGWAERASDPRLFKPRASYAWMMTWLPKTWLLREGWKKHPLVSLREVPGPIDVTRGTGVKKRAPPVTSA